MKKVLVVGPALSRSGYGEQTRFAIRCLQSRPDAFELYLVNTMWGKTGCLTDIGGEEYQYLMNTMRKTHEYQSNNGQFDLSVQVTIPPEWKPLAPINIGYTAGIETTKVAPQWLEAGNLMDKIIVVSNHSKNTYEQTTYEATHKETGETKNLHLETPIEVVNYPVREFSPEPLDLNLDYENNFLAVSQWGPRKNMGNTVKWFVEEFKDEEVGLIVKTNMAKDCVMDREAMMGTLKSLLAPYEDRKCKVYLLHGTLTEGNLTWLYQHDKIKALINIGHGEGYGLPLFEAAYNGMPLVAVPWSGQNDFIVAPNKKGKLRTHICKVDYELKPIQKGAVWPGVLQADSMWAFAREGSYKRALRDLLKSYPRHKSAAKNLQRHILTNFTAEDMYEEFCSHVDESLVTVDVDELPTISLITSVFKAGDHIEQLMEDVTRQTIFKEKCEWIILNANEAGDPEEDVILKYVEKYPDNIKYKRLDEDKGVYATWNEAIKMSTGEYITNMNCDDRRAPSALAQQANMLYTNEKVDLVYNDSYVSYEANTMFEDVPANITRYNFEQFSLDAMLRGNMPHNNPMWKRRVHDKYGYFNEEYRSASDWEFWLKCAFGGAQFKKLPNILGVYYFNPEGISTNVFNERWKREEEKAIFKKYFALYNQNK